MVELADIGLDHVPSPFGGMIELAGEGPAVRTNVKVSSLMVLLVAAGECMVVVVVAKPIDGAGDMFD
jgi:hypothetical protein